MKQSEKIVYYGFLCYGEKCCVTPCYFLPICIMICVTSWKHFPNPIYNTDSIYKYQYSGAFAFLSNPSFPICMYVYHSLLTLIQKKQETKRNSALHKLQDNTRTALSVNSLQGLLQNSLLLLAQRFRRGHQSVQAFHREIQILPVVQFPFRQFQNLPSNL